MATLRNEPIQQRARDTLDAVIAAADGLFAEYGVGDTTNQMIADKAGVSIGTIYRFFPNKSALVDEYLARYGEMLLAQTPELPESVSVDQLDEVVSGLLSRSIETRRVFRGYGRVRQWRDPATGNMASQNMRAAELALIGALITASPYTFEPDQVERMAMVIVDGSWPLIEDVLELPKRKQPAMIVEIERFVSAYVRSAIAELA